MCQVTFYKHLECKCRWGEIAVSCGPGMGFSTCGQIGSGIAKKPYGFERAVLRPCPEHGLHGFYDRNMVRKIVAVRDGIKWGTGPSKQDSGIEFPCVVL